MEKELNNIIIKYTHNKRKVTKEKGYEKVCVIYGYCITN